MINLLYILIIFISTVRCVSDYEQRKAEFDAVEIGMVKSEVLDIAGPPHWSDHKHDHDRWIYYMKPEGRQSEKIIYFRKGVVVRKGLREKPVLTPEEMDEIKKPKPIKPKPFTPTYTKEELRKVIKKAVDEEEKRKPKDRKDSNLEQL